MKCYRVKVYYDDSPKSKSLWSTAMYCGCIVAESRTAAIETIKGDERDTDPKRRILKITAQVRPENHICSNY